MEISYPGEMSDWELVKQAQIGNVAAFEILSFRHKDKCHRFIYSYIRDFSQSEDLLQETFLCVWKHIHNIKPLTNYFTTYLFTIARNLSIKFINNHKNDYHYPLLGDENDCKTKEPWQALVSTNDGKMLADCLAY